MIRSKLSAPVRKKRSLKGIMSRKITSNLDEDRVSQLSKTLNKDNEKLYQCPGHTPWYGSEYDFESCSAYPIAVLKNSINVYYPNTISAIHLPKENPDVEKIIDIFEKNGITASLLADIDNVETKVKLVTKLCPPEIRFYEKSDIKLAILYIEGLIDKKNVSESVSSKKAEKELRKKRI